MARHATWCGPQLNGNPVRRHHRPGMSDMDWAEFPGHEVVLETARTVLRPFRESDFLVALPLYADPELRQALDHNAAANELEYLRSAGLYMAEHGLLFAIDLKPSGRPIGEVCFERMNLERANVK